MYNYLLLYCEKKEVKKFETLQEMLPVLDAFAVFNGSPKIRLFRIFTKSENYPSICEKFNEEGIAEWNDDLEKLLEK